MRDYYCTSVSKAGYAWHPAEFLFQSGVLAEHFDVQIIDAIAQELNPHEAARLIREPVDLLVGLVGAACPDEDLDFIRKIPARLKVVSGEVVLPQPAKWLANHKGIDAAMSDFSIARLLDLAEGAEEAPGLAIRSKRGISTPTSVNTSFIDIPTPCHELFNMRAYRMPLQKHRPYAELLTDFGCPHRCSFCNSGSLPYRRRRADGIDRELDLIQRLGLRQIFLKDMSFGAHSEHAVMIADLLAARDFDWHCYARIDNLTDVLIERMARAGCRLVQIGVEHVNEKILRRAGKRYTPGRIRDVFQAIRRAGMDAGAHLVLGLPGETPETLKELERFIDTFDDAIYLSINLYAPRMGSPLAGIGEVGDGPHDSTNGSDFGALPKAVLVRARNAMYRGFYLRPARIMRLARKMHPDDMTRSLTGFLKRVMLKR